MQQTNVDAIPFFSDAENPLAQRELPKPALVRSGRLKGAWVYWPIVFLTDRFGDMKCDFHKEDTSDLIDPKTLLDLRRQMWDEVTFVARLGETFGLLFEVEYRSKESAADSADQKTISRLKSHDELLVFLLDALPSLLGDFPGVEFSIPSEDLTFDNHLAMWAFVPNGHLTDERLEELGTRLLNLVPPPIEQNSIFRLMVEITAPATVSEAEAIDVLGRLISSGQSDASRTLEDEGGDTQAAQLAAALDIGLISTLPARSSVPVKRWDSYNDPRDRGTPTHQIDLDDQRVSNGQLYVDIGAREGRVDDLLALTAEININPCDGVHPVPCVHVHFDESNLAFSMFKQGDKIIIRPETNVVIESQPLDIGGVRETIYIAS